MRHLAIIAALLATGCADQTAQIANSPFWKTKPSAATVRSWAKEIVACQRTAMVYIDDDAQIGIVTDFYKGAGPVSDPHYRAAIIQSYKPKHLRGRYVTIEMAMWASRPSEREVLRALAQSVASREFD